MVHLIALVWLVLALPAWAQSYPTRPVRLVVPWPPGGTVDGVARVMSNKVATDLGQPLVVDNKPGAGGALGAASVASAAADGYTVLMVFDTHAVNHHLYKKLGYDPFTAFVAISQLVASPQVVAAANAFAPATLADVIGHAKAHPGDVTYGSVGTGSSNHLNALSLEARTGIKMLHVPYKGGAPMMQELIAGGINIMFVSAPQAIPQAKAGRIRALAVGSLKRMAQLPDTPALAETLAGFEAASWVGLVAPAATPAPILARLHQVFSGALADPDVNGRLTAQGFDIVGSSPAAFDRFVHEESDRLGKVIRDNAIVVE